MRFAIGAFGVTCPLQLQCHGHNHCIHATLMLPASISTPLTLSSASMLARSRASAVESATPAAPAPAATAASVARTRTPLLRERKRKKGWMVVNAKRGDVIEVQ